MRLHGEGADEWAPSTCVIGTRACPWHIHLGRARIVTTDELHRLDYYHHALRPLGIEHQMRLWLSAPPGIARYFYVGRRQVDGDFTDRDRDLLELLRPSLAALRNRFDAHLPCGDNGHGLTDRETEVLAWVARGKTNPEIAALLIVSPHTVRKHLERTFEKLRVHTRTAAVARALAPVDFVPDAEAAPDFDGIQPLEVGAATLATPIVP